MKEGLRADGTYDDEYCGYCKHHFTQHTYDLGKFVAVTCKKCPDGVCTR